MVTVFRYSSVCRSRSADGQRVDNLGKKFGDGGYLVHAVVSSYPAIAVAVAPPFRIRHGGTGTSPQVNGRRAGLTAPANMKFLCRIQTVVL